MQDLVATILERQRQEDLAEVDAQRRGVVVDAKNGTSRSGPSELQILAKANSERAMEAAALAAR
jgi:hypothetical protein